MGLSLALSPSTLNYFYYSFKTFPRLLLAKSTHIIHHNQLLMTKLGRILRLMKVNAPLTVKTWGRG